MLIPKIRTFSKTEWIINGFFFRHETVSFRQVLIIQKPMLPYCSYNFYNHDKIRRQTRGARRIRELQYEDALHECILYWKDVPTLLPPQVPHRLWQKGWSQPRKSKRRINLDLFETFFDDHCDLPQRFIVCLATCSSQISEFTFWISSIFPLLGPALAISDAYLFSYFFIHYSNGRKVSERRFSRRYHG